MLHKTNLLCMFCVFTSFVSSNVSSWFSDTRDFLMFIEKCFIENEDMCSSFPQIPLIRVHTIRYIISVCIDLYVYISYKL